jgi:hypothetical protein
MGAELDYSDVTISESDYLDMLRSIEEAKVLLGKSKEKITSLDSENLQLKKEVDRLKYKVNVAYAEGHRDGYNCEDFDPNFKISDKIKPD